MEPITFIFVVIGAAATVDRFMRWVERMENERS